MANIPIQFNMQNIARPARANLPQALRSAGYTQGEGGMGIYGWRIAIKRELEHHVREEVEQQAMCTSVVSWVSDGRGEDAWR
jgi:hypothetical protein